MGNNASGLVFMLVDENEIGNEVNEKLLSLSGQIATIIVKDSAT